MADGFTHERYSRTGWYLIIPIGLIWYASSDWNCFYPLLLYFNYLLVEISSPDLDHSMITRDEHDAKRFFKKLSLGLFIPELIFKNKKWNKIRSILKKINLGIIGVSYVAWSQFYEYFSGKHRSWFSHWWIVGTVTRMIWINVPFYLFLNYMVNYSIVNWGTPPWEVVGFNYYWMNLWLVPYIVTQGVAWFIGDAYHFILDLEWAKGRLYDFEKHGDKRRPLLKKIIKKDWVHPPPKKKRKR